MSFLNIQGILGNFFSLGKGSNEVQLRSNSGVLQAMDNGGSWTNVLGQSGGLNVVGKSANYTLTVNDNIVLVTTDINNIDITLPDASLTTGKLITVKKVDSGVGTIDILTVNSQTIDGVSTKSIASEYAYITLISDGTNYFIINSTLWN